MSAYFSSFSAGLIRYLFANLYERRLNTKNPTIRKNEKKVWYWRTALLTVVRFFCKKVFFVFK